MKFRKPPYFIGIGVAIILLCAGVIALIVPIVPGWLLIFVAVALFLEYHPVKWLVKLKKKLMRKFK